MKNFETLHQRALKLVKEIRSREAELLQILQEIDFRSLGYPSLFSYCTRGIELSEASAYQFITVSRRGKEVPELMRAIEAGEITVSKAKSICAALNQENFAEWLEKAKTSSTRELEARVAAATGKDEAKIVVSHKARDLLARTQELLAQKSRKPVSSGEALEFLAVHYLEKKDPIRKLTLPMKSTVLKRDTGKCQFKLADGKVCGSGHWVHLHHVQPKEHGGSNELENLITLCSAHHRMTHA